MSVAESMLPEFEQEMARTRALLERTPEARAEWRPHPRSMTLGRLAVHLAEIPAWASSALTMDEFDVAPPGGRPRVPTPFPGGIALLELFDRNVRTARERLAAASDDEFGRSWTMKRGGQAMFSLPKRAVIRTLLLNHLIHHRGQFTVYLRLNDVRLPGLYGPTADEAL